MADNYWTDHKVAQFARAYKNALEVKEMFLKEKDSKDSTASGIARDRMSHALLEYRGATTIEVRELLRDTLNLESLEKMCH